MQFTQVKYNTITKENIKEMVVKFYTKVLNEDNEVTKVFVAELGDNLQSDTWQEHIDILTNFWAMIALQDEMYNGNPMMKHFNLPLNKDMFGSWLIMFFQVVDSLYEEKLGMIFKQRAQNIAGNFMRNMGLT